jgi:hypothetical protein
LVGTRLIDLRSADKIIGWRLTLNYYRDRIYKAIQMIQKSVTEVHRLNRTYADTYGASYVFEKMDRLLRSISPLQENLGLHTQRLDEDARTYREAEEAKLRKKLNELNFVIEDMGSIRRIISFGRPEQVSAVILKKG